MLPLRLVRMERISITHPKAVNFGVEILQKGGVIAAPTDTIYGLACDATNTTAIQNMYNIKCRHENKPLAICLGEIVDINLVAKTSHLPPSLLPSLLPGPVTIILDSLNKIDPYINPKGQIGIRIPNYPFIRKLCNVLGRPLALTSANKSSEVSAVCPEEFQGIWDKISVVFDGGVTHLDKSGSTIVDLSVQGEYGVLREGVAFEDTVKVLGRFGLMEKGV